MGRDGEAVWVTPAHRPVSPIRSPLSQSQSVPQRFRRVDSPVMRAPKPARHRSGGQSSVLSHPAMRRGAPAADGSQWKRDVRADRFEPASRVGPWAGVWSPRSKTAGSDRALSAHTRLLSDDRASQLDVSEWGSNMKVRVCLAAAALTLAGLVGVMQQPFGFESADQSGRDIVCTDAAVNTDGGIAEQAQVYVDCMGGRAT